eukprot:g1056.t1
MPGRGSLGARFTKRLGSVAKLFGGEDHAEDGTTATTTSAQPPAPPASGALVSASPQAYNADVEEPEELQTNPVVQSGTLFMKKGVLLSTRWESRFFELYDDNSLRRWRNEKARREGAPQTAEDTIIGSTKDLDEGRKGRPHSFEVQIRGQLGQSRSLELAAESAEDKTRWVNAINQHVQGAEPGGGINSHTAAQGQQGVVSPTHRRDVIEAANYMTLSSGVSGIWLECRKQYCKVRDPTNDAPSSFLVLYDGERVNKWGDRERRAFDLAGHEFTECQQKEKKGRYELRRTAGADDPKSMDNDSTAIGKNEDESKSDAADIGEVQDRFSNEAERTCTRRHKMYATQVTIVVQHKHEVPLQEHRQKARKFPV